MGEPCKFENEIIDIGKNIASMRADLANAITNTTQHIQAGAKWRLAIVIACIGLVGTFIGGVVRFGVVEYKVENIQAEIKLHTNQIYDLNYTKGYATGLAEK